MRLEHFWQQLQTGVSVAVAGNHPAQLLGVRDGFLRYFHQGLGRSLSVAVVPQPLEPSAGGLPLGDDETLARARAALDSVEHRVGGAYHFLLACEGGLHTVELEGQARHFVRSWSVVRSAVGESWGGSGSLQLPERLLAGLDDAEIPFAVPGTRRAGGMLSSLTGGLESRRQATAQATCNALSSLLYGLLGHRSERRRG